MATYFLNCSTNIENFNLCLQHNVAGFPSSGYKQGDLIYLIVKEQGDWKLGGKGILSVPTSKKPWADAEKYSSAFNVNWQKIDKPVITEGLRNIYPPNFGLAIQGKKNLDIFQNKGSEIKKYLDSFFSSEHLTSIQNESKISPRQLINHTYKYITNSGFQYQKEEVANFYLSLRTKPFVILAGISGTGKTQLPRKFAEALGFSGNQLRQIPVKPDWTDSSELIGYVSLDGKFIEKELTLAINEASSTENQNKPYFFILDEMNLARVEHYFSDFLSVIETRKRNGSNINTDPILRKEHLNSIENQKDFKELDWPQNLFLIGTVNMDETTHTFSRKVLDRANSIEMNEVDLNWIKTSGETVDPLKSIDYSYFETPYIISKELTKEEKESVSDELGKLIEINKILQKADLHFAYRVRDEIAFYLVLNKKYELMDDQTAFDFQLVQKVLPRIHGSSERIYKVLVELLYFIELGQLEHVRTDQDFEKIESLFPVGSLKFKRASKKILFMLKRFDEDRFTSFWL
ncbi:MAG: AAA family ATPase [Prolixibacteraceae bacterium]|nr:AAA family ATPase [Prolixibacteraceae bacterium]